MTRLEVENKVSLTKPSKSFARWNIKRDTGQITLFLPAMWDDSEEAAKNIPASVHINYPRWQDLVLEEFIGNLTFSYLMERVCLERAHDKIRLKRNKCKPCAVAPIVNKMFDYIIESWKI